MRRECVATVRGGFLSPPLAAGNHTATATFHFNAAVSGSQGCTPDPSPGSTPAGTTQSFNKTIAVADLDAE